VDVADEDATGRGQERQIRAITVKPGSPGPNRNTGQDGHETPAVRTSCGRGRERPRVDSAHGFDGGDPYSRASNARAPILGLCHLGANRHIQDLEVVASHRSRIAVPSPR
jgi:hypothetical protein